MSIRLLHDEPAAEKSNPLARRAVRRVCVDAERVSDYASPAAWYDRMYAHIGKNYAAEADVIDGIVRSRCPGAQSLLDVGCGTGLHLQRFTELFDVAAGVDLDPQFVAQCRDRGLQVDIADMRAFDLGRRFDAVTCLFSAVAHAGGAAELAAAIASMALHMQPGGLLVVEPWLREDEWRDGRYGVEVVDAPGSTLVRASHSASDGNVSVVKFAWTEVGEWGVRRLDETLRLTRFTDAQFTAAFTAAGLRATFDAVGCNAGGRGLWIATHA